MFNDINNNSTIGHRSFRPRSRLKFGERAFAYRHQKPGTVYPTTSDWKPAQTALNEN